MTSVELKPCKQCNYSAPPVLRKSERKHFDPHAFECSRCLWSPETMGSEELAVIAWNTRASDPPSTPRLIYIASKKEVKPDDMVFFKGEIARIEAIGDKITIKQVGSNTSRELEVSPEDIGVEWQ